MATPNKPEPAQRPPKQRFSWPLRIFLIVFMYDMFSRSLILLTPAGSDWLDELSMYNQPMPLPGPEDLRRAEAGEDPRFTSSNERILATLKSAGRYLVPYPEAETRENITSLTDVGKYALTWIGSRQRFIGRLAGVDQQWQMYSPDVGNQDPVARLLLFYDDGTSQVHYLDCDPVDPTRYWRWFQKKQLNAACLVSSDVDARLGYCHMVARAKPRNDNGAKLLKIQVFEVTYYYPGPYDDAYAYLKSQAGPPADQIDEPFWEYIVATGEGKYLD